LLNIGSAFGQLAQAMMLDGKIKTKKKCIGTDATGDYCSHK